MAEANIEEILNTKITLTVGQLKGLLPAAFGPIVDGAVSVFSTWSRDEIAAWLVLANSAPDEARAKLLSAMTEAEQTAGTEVHGAALGALVISSADRIAAQKALLFEAFKAVVVLAAGMLA